MEETNDKRWSVYIHINKINNKVYIGITNNILQRWSNCGNTYKDKNESGKYKQLAFASALDRYPDWDNDWEHKILFENLTYETACEKEIELIALYHSNVSRWHDEAMGYNMTDGGGGTAGVQLSEERKQRLRERQIEKFKNPEEREKLSKLAKERFSNPENNPMYQKHHSEQSKMLMSKRIREEMADEKLRQKLSDLKKGVYDGEKNPSYGSGKVVVQLTKNDELIAEHISALDASRKVGIHYSAIYRCCNNTPGCHSAGGFRWMYKEDYDKLTQQNDLNEIEPIEILEEDEI
jgi:group I intron endonuclease